MTRYNVEFLLVYLFLSNLSNQVKPFRFGEICVIVRNYQQILIPFLWKKVLNFKDIFSFDHNPQLNVKFFTNFFLNYEQGTKRG